MTESAHGEFSHGEKDNLLVASRLLERLRQDGDAWGPPVMQGPKSRTETGVDFTSTTAAGMTLRAQVTRAQVDPRYWRTLDGDGAVVDSCSFPDAAQDIRKAIEKKADRISGAQRRSLVLVLDATRVGGHGMQPVVSTFETHHGTWASALGFQAIWIVGLSGNLTFRLA